MKKYALWSLLAALGIFLFVLFRPTLNGFLLVRGYTADNAYNFPPGGGKLDIPLAPGEYSRWIVMPPGSYWTDYTTGPIRICFRDGECFNDGPTMANWYGLRRGIFIIQNLGTTQVAVTVAAER